MNERERLPDPLIRQLKDKMNDVRKRLDLDEIDHTNILVDPARIDIVALAERIRATDANEGLRGTKIVDGNLRTLHKLIWPAQNLMHTHVREAISLANPDWICSSETRFAPDQKDGSFSQARMDEIMGWMHAKVTQHDLPLEE